MSALENKIDFVMFISVHGANANGDPLDGNRPRTDYNGYGEMSDVCIKRKIRNRMQDLGHKIFVQSDDRCDDGCDSLSKRAAESLKQVKGSKEQYAAEACKMWLDVRSFGQVFAFEGNSDKGKGSGKKNHSKGVSVGVRGPVSIHQAVSMSPVEIKSMKITKSVNSQSKENHTKSSDTMGDKHFIRFGLYEIKGSINVQLAEKTGFSSEDADVIKECLKTLFINDASSARPEGSMEVVKLFWWQHNCKDGQYSSAKVHRSVHAVLKDGVDIPAAVDDYVITVDELAGLEPEIIAGW